MQGCIEEQLKNIYRKGFPEDSENYIDYFFSAFATSDNIVFHEENGKIISAGYIVEKPAVIFGKETTFPYVTALATLPEYRGKGKLRFVMKKAFEILRERNYAFFGLHPFDYEYYKRFGLGNISYACHSTVLGGKNYVVKDYCEEDFPIVKRIYDEMCYSMQNRLVLNRETFGLKVKEYLADGISCKLLSDGDGYFAFAFVDKGNIDYYASTDMGKLYSAECFKGCTFCDFTEKREPYLQGRIVDARGALKLFYTAYKPEKEVRLRITDDITEENNICVSVVCKNNEIVINDSDFADNTYSIGEFTEKLFCGFNNFFPDKY